MRKAILSLCKGRHEMPSNAVNTTVNLYLMVVMTN